MKIVITASLKRGKVCLDWNLPEGKAMDRMKLLLGIKQAIENEIEALRREVDEAGLLL